VGGLLRHTGREGGGVHAPAWRGVIGGNGMMEDRGGRAGAIQDQHKQPRCCHRAVVWSVGIAEAGTAR